MKVLITGGAGFSGSHLVDGPLADGHGVRALDNLDGQVHPGRERADYLRDEYCAGRPHERLSPDRLEQAVRVSHLPQEQTDLLLRR